MQMTWNQAHKVFSISSSIEWHVRALACYGENMKSGRGKKKWDRMIPLLLFASREAIHDFTSFTPDLVYGRPVRGPLDIIPEQLEETEDLPSQSRNT